MEGIEPGMVGFGEGLGDAMGYRRRRTRTGVKCNLEDMVEERTGVEETAKRVRKSGGRMYDMKPKVYS